MDKVNPLSFGNGLLTVPYHILIRNLGAWIRYNFYKIRWIVSHFERQ